MSLPKPGSPAEAATSALIREAANRGEAILGAVRSAFVTLVFVRFLVYWRPDRGPTNVWSFVLPILVMSAAIAAFVKGFLLARRGLFTTRWLVVSTLADAAVCFAGLVANVFWPDPDYIGLLRMPDVNTLLLMVLISTLRLTPLATIAAGLANVVSLAGLAALDYHFNGARVPNISADATMMMLLIATTTAICWGLSAAARQLVVRAGIESARSERARRSLRTLLHEHHDVRSLLAAARLQIDLLRQEGDGGRRRDERLSSLSRTLTELRDFVESVKSRALSELTVADSGAAVAVAPVLGGVADAVRARFPHVDLQLDVGTSVAVVRVVGGERGLAHVLSGLLVNACEGDGQRAAQRVDVRAEPERRDDLGIRIEIRDDGPGLPETVLTRGGADSLSTKPQGSGLGLTLVRAVVESSGGHLELANGPDRGARVSVWLPI
jgi:signal transduction histidine kinase